MSSRKFASITGSLLARKGEAGPSPAMRTMTPRDLSPDGGDRALRLPPPSVRERDAAMGPHRLTFRLDDERHRRLSIASARLQTPAQHLLAAALDRYLADLCENELKDCACLRQEGCCRDADVARDRLDDIRRPA